MKMKVGLDIGSKNISYAVITGDHLFVTGICEHSGDIQTTYHQVPDIIEKSLPKSGVCQFGVTGSVPLEGQTLVDPVIATVEANRYFKILCRSILSIGCEQFYRVLMDENNDYTSHEFNSDCASGKGSFLDQQSKRLGMETQELALRAAACADQPPSISTRCAVFAKSDIIHAQALGGEILFLSYNELIIHAMLADVRDLGDDPRMLKSMLRYEKQFESVFEPFLDNHREPDPFECQDLIIKEGFVNFIADETAVSIGRMLYYIHHGIVDAVIHVNPVFCCPDVVSSSLLKKIEKRYHIPVIDLFYDGTNSPNRVITPRLYYMLKQYSGNVNQPENIRQQAVTV